MRILACLLAFMPLAFPVAVALAGSSSYVSVWVDPAAFEFDHEQRSPIPIKLVTFNYAELREDLLKVGVTEIQKTFPGWVPADTLGIDLLGNQVKLIDLSRFYRLFFADMPSAEEALSVLATSRGVVYADLAAGDGSVQSSPNDPFFDCWPPLCPDAQWNLQNDGGGSGVGQCGGSVQDLDARVDPIPFWYNGGGDGSIVIGHVDVGIYDDHLDLHVLQVPDPDLITRWPGDDFCGAHGTRMAGIEAARTNNAIGIAGTCPNCSILDISVPGCSAASCSIDATDCGSVTAQWGTQVGNALDPSFPVDVHVLNCEFSFENEWSPEDISLLWNAFKLGTVIVAPSGNRSYPTASHYNAPARYSFVVGSGGFTWEGKFWDVKTSCYPDSIYPDKGTTVSDRNVDICAPSSGVAVTTNHPSFGSHQDFNITLQQTSGAAASVAGGIGLIQSMAKVYRGAVLDSDDAVGILEATALEFTDDPTDPANASCPSCPRGYYGRGRLNLAGAAEALLGGYSWDVRVLGRKDATITMTRTFLAGNVQWREYLVRADVIIPASLFGEYLPGHVAWVRVKDSNTFDKYWETPVFDEVTVVTAQLGIHDCRLSLIDQTTGEAAVTGYLYEFRNPQGQWEYLVAPDALRMVLVALLPKVVGVGPEDGRAGSSKLEVDAISNPTSPPVMISYSVLGRDVIVGTLFDVAGRVVRRFEEGPRSTGRHWLYWDGSDSRGDRVASGMYWLQLTGQAGQEVRRLVMLH